MTTRPISAAGMAGLGFCIWWAWAGTRDEGGGAGWRFGEPVAEVSAASLAGPLRNDPGRMELAGLRRAEAPVTFDAGDKLEIDVELTPGGSLLWRATDDADARAPNGPSPGSGAPGPGRHQGGSGPPGPPPGGGRPPPSGVKGTQAEQAKAAGILFDYGSRAQVRGNGALTCEPIPLTSGRIQAAIESTAAGLSLTVNDVTVACTGPSLLGRWGLRPGVQRVRVNSVVLTHGEKRRFAFSGRRWSGGWPAGIGAALLGAVAGWLAAPRFPWAARLFAPLIVSPLFALVPLAEWLDAMRLPRLPESVLPLFFGGLASALVGGAIASARLPVRQALALGAIPALGLLPSRILFQDGLGWSLMALALVPWVVLCWANARRVRAVGLWSWAGLLLMLALTEGGARLTSLGTTWVRTEGYERAGVEFRELLQMKEYRSYPSEGFPIRPPVRRAGVRRIVALGGSSTGGAYQMDNLDLFWPRRLEESVEASGWEVVNQGVGGWNTLHIRLYVESQLAMLSPDILVLYVGHNDILSRSVATHASFLERYRAPPNAVLTTASDLVHQSRLFVGFKFLLLSWRGQGMMAVPPDDARKNLSTILDLAAKQGAHVLLVTEGLNPDARPMAVYADLAAELAASRGQRAFDAATRFEAEGNPDDFIDDCHPTVGGHLRLASWIEAELRSAGWL